MIFALTSAKHRQLSFIYGHSCFRFVCFRSCSSARFEIIMENGEFSVPCVGQSFATYDEFQRHLSNHQKETNYVYTISRSVSVASGNKLLKSSKSAPFKDEWRYKQATVGCKQYGNRASESTGMRSVQR